MSRLSRVLLALLVPAEVLLALALLLPRVGASSEAETLVRAYLQRQGTAVPPGSAVQQLVRASRPWNLTPDMSGATFGSGVPYQTSQGLSVRPSRGQGLRPLLYPPMEVWCVRLRQAEQIPSGVLFLARHQDLYSGDWVLHGPAASSARALAADMSSLGCDLRLGGE